MSALEPIDQGVSNAMFRLRTDRGVFAVKVHTAGVSLARAARSATFESEVAAGGTPVAPMMRTQGGAAAAVLPAAGRPGHVVVRVHRWLPARGPSVSSPGSLLALGGALARAHAAARSTSEPVGDWLSRPVTEQQWQEVVGEARRQKAPWAGRLEIAVGQFLQQGDLVRAAGRERVRLQTHGDLAPDNSVRSGLGFRVIDFDGPVPLAAEEELAMVAAKWLFRGHGRPPVDGAFLIAGYREAGGTASPSLEDFGPYLAGRQNWILENARIALGLDHGPKWGPEEAAQHLLAALEDTPTRRECERLLASMSEPVQSG